MKQRVLKFSHRVIRRWSINKLKANKGLWNALNQYQEKSKSTGCSWSDLWQLYHTVRTRKPKEILECGTGVSTMVIAYALMENEQEGHKGRITSMEELDIYLEMAMSLMPGQLHSYIDFVLSPRVEDYYFFFRGVRYKNVPSDRAYDFVFVDGPELSAPSDGMLTFDFDYVSVTLQSEQPVYGIVDYRLSTSYALQQIFGKNKVKFSALHDLAFVGPCNKHDAIVFSLDNLTDAYRKHINLLGSTEIKIQ